MEWLRAAGLSYRELEQRGYGFVVVEARLFYRKAAFFDDELTLCTELTDLGRASLRFSYTLSRGGEVVSSGYTRHGCIELATGKARRVPREILDGA